MPFTVITFKEVLNVYFTESAFPSDLTDGIKVVIFKFVLTLIFRVSVQFRIYVLKS